MNPTRSGRRGVGIRAEEMNRWKIRSPSIVRGVASPSSPSSTYLGAVRLTSRTAKSAAAQFRWPFASAVTAASPARPSAADGKLRRDLGAGAASGGQCGRYRGPRIDRIPALGDCTGDRMLGVDSSTRSKCRASVSLREFHACSARRMLINDNFVD